MSNNNNNPLSAILDNPETMKKITEMASELAGGSGASSASSSRPSPDPASELMQKAVPLLSSIARSSQNAADPDRLRLFSALKPFVSDSVAMQMDHAARLLSVAQMTRTAATQILSQEASGKENKE